MLPKLALQASAFLVVFFDLKWIIHSLVRKKNEPRWRLIWGDARGICHIGQLSF